MRAVMCHSECGGNEREECVDEKAQGTFSNTNIGVVLFDPRRK